MNYHLDGVILALIQLHVVVGDIVQLAVNSCPAEALLYQLVQLFLELALAAPNDGSQDHNPLFRFEFHDPLDDLLGRLA